MNQVASKFKLEKIEVNGGTIFKKYMGESEQQVKNVCMLPHTSTEDQYIDHLTFLGFCRAFTKGTCPYDYR